MKPREKRKLQRRRRRLEKRLARTNLPVRAGPVFKTSNVVYEVSERTKATAAGGVGAAHVLAKKVGLIEAIDRTLHLLKMHMPYHESDHVTNIAYVMMARGSKLEDLELLRQDERYMDMLGTDRIPDPTTAGDFLRRFSALDVIALMEAVNPIRVKLWKRQPRSFRRLGVIDTDGTVAPTGGEKKLGMGLNHKGIWGYHPLLVSLANTDEPLYIVNRPGNVVSHEDAVMWIDRAVELTRQAFDEVLLRGDTDFSLTENFDRWTGEGVRFVFGYDACRNLVQRADSLPDSRWRLLERRARYEVKTRERERRENVNPAWPEGEYDLTFSAEEAPAEVPVSAKEAVGKRAKVEGGQIAYEETHGTLIVRLCGAFRGPECDAMSDDVVARVRSNPCDVVIDLWRVTYMNSYVFGTFVKLGEKLRVLGRDLTLAAAGGHVHRLLETVGLSAMFGSYPTVAEAIESLHERHRAAR